MRDAIFILFVAFILFGLSAIRYRKQISGVIGFARVLNDAKESAGQSRTINRKDRGSVQLVNCAGCGVWVPQNKAMKLRDGFSYCEKCRG